MIIKTIWLLIVFVSITLAQQKITEEHIFGAEIFVKLDNETEPFAKGLTDSLGQFMVKLPEANDLNADSKKEFVDKVYFFSINLQKEFFISRKAEKEIVGTYYFSLEIMSNNENYTLYFSVDLTNENELNEKGLIACGPFLQSLTSNITKMTLEVTLQSVRYNSKNRI